MNEDTIKDLVDFCLKLQDEDRFMPKEDIQEELRIILDKNGCRDDNDYNELVYEVIQKDEELFP